MRCRRRCARSRSSEPCPRRRPPRRSSCHVHRPARAADFADLMPAGVEGVVLFDGYCVPVRPVGAVRPRSRPSTRLPLRRVADARRGHVPGPLRPGRRAGHDRLRRARRLVGAIDGRDPHGAAARLPMGGRRRRPRRPGCASAISSTVWSRRTASAGSASATPAASRPRRRRAASSDRSRRGVEPADVHDPRCRHARAARPDRGARVPAAGSRARRRRCSRPSTRRSAAPTCICGTAGLPACRIRSSRGTCRWARSPSPTGR